MTWNNLKNGKCPSCNGPLRETVGKFGAYMKCESCPFKVGMERFQELIRPHYNPAHNFKRITAYQTEEDRNQEALNNL